MRTTSLFTLKLLTVVLLLLVLVLDAHAESYLMKRRPVPATVASTQSTSPNRMLATAADAKAVEKISKMSARELKKYISARDATCHGCVDRQHLLEKALEVRRAPTQDEVVASHLALVQHSVVSQPAPHHFREQTALETAALHLLQHSLTKRHCQLPLGNGTVMCVQYTM